MFKSERQNENIAQKHITESLYTAHATHLKQLYNDKKTEYTDVNKHIPLHTLNTVTEQCMHVGCSIIIMHQTLHVSIHCLCVATLCSMH